MKNLAPALILMTVFSYGCNSSDQAFPSQPATPSQVGVSGQRDDHPSKLQSEWGVGELSKVCAYLVSKNLLKADSTFEIRMIESNASVNAAVDQKEYQSSALQGNCALGQEVLTLSARDTLEGPYTLTTERTATQSFSSSRIDQMVDSTDEFETSMLVTTDGPGGHTNGPDDRQATAKVSDLKIENSGDSFVFHYDLNGTEQRKHPDGTTSSSPFSYEVTTEMTIPASTGAPAAVSLSFKSLGADASKEQDYSISLRSR
jgi:hypothetical protein